MDPNTFFYTDTERMTTNSFVPFRSFPCSLVGVKARPHRSLTEHGFPQLMIWTFQARFIPDIVRSTVVLARIGGWDVSGLTTTHRSVAASGRGPVTIQSCANHHPVMLRSSSDHAPTNQSAPHRAPITIRSCTDQPISPGSCTSQHPVTHQIVTQSWMRKTSSSHTTIEPISFSHRSDQILTSMSRSLGEDTLLLLIISVRCKLTFCRLECFMCPQTLLSLALIVWSGGICISRLFLHSISWRQIVQELDVLHD